MKAEIIRECPNPKCGACGIKEFNNRPGYNMDIGEIVPQECPNCGTSLGQKYWGNIDRINKDCTAMADEALTKETKQ